MTVRPECDRVEIKAILGDYEKPGISRGVMVTSGVRCEVSIDRRVASNLLRVQVEELIEGGRAFEKGTCGTVYCHSCVYCFHDIASAGTEPLVGWFFAELGVVVNP
jgi:hypothetical protein